MRTLADALPRYVPGLGLGREAEGRERNESGADREGPSHEGPSHEGNDRTERSAAADASRDATSRAMVEGRARGLDVDRSANIADRAATAAAEGARAGGSKEAGDAAGRASIERDLQAMRDAAAAVKPSTIMQTLSKVTAPLTAPIHAVIEGPLTPLGMAAQQEGAKRLDASITRARQQAAADQAVGYERLGTPSRPESEPDRNDREASGLARLRDPFGVSSSAPAQASSRASGVDVPSESATTGGLVVAPGSVATGGAIAAPGVVTAESSSHGGLLLAGGLLALKLLL